MRPDSAGCVMSLSLRRTRLPRAAASCQSARSRATSRCAQPERLRASSAAPSAPPRSPSAATETSGGCESLNRWGCIAAAIRSVDAEQPINAMMTMEKSIHNRAIGLNYMAVLMGIFGVLAMGLAAIGVYGVMAYMVTEQSHEIGVRMALGASRQNVLGAVFRRGMLTIGAGLLVGLPLAYGFARLMASLIFGVTATDPTTFAGIPLALMAAAALAIYVPARRAMNIDPIVALRYE